MKKRYIPTLILHIIAIVLIVFTPVTPIISYPLLAIMAIYWSNIILKLNYKA